MEINCEINSLNTRVSTLSPLSLALSQCTNSHSKEMQLVGATVFIEPGYSLKTKISIVVTFDVGTFRVVRGRLQFFTP